MGAAVKAEVVVAEAEQGTSAGNSGALHLSLLNQLIWKHT